MHYETMKPSLRISKGKYKNLDKNPSSFHIDANFNGWNVMG